MLLGWDAGEVLALYWRTAGDPDAGATILDTLKAAGGQLAGKYGYRCDSGIAVGSRELAPPVATILGVTLPEPHAIAVTPGGGWWSWGEPFDPADWPDLTIEEVWAVTSCLR